MKPRSKMALLFVLGCLVGAIVGGMVIGWHYASNRIMITNIGTDNIEIQNDHKKNKLILGQNGTGYFHHDSKLQIRIWAGNQPRTTNN